MAYEVLARKWRPQQFADVVGQEHVTRTLINAIRSNRVAHAYLLVGPRGIGKTSIARIMAKALNCAQGPTEKPCDKCSACMEIMAGTQLDVQEIDGASNRGIDDIRALRDTIRYLPSGRFKIIIIDEVHQVTPDAFNALLKTLEEPPPQVKFIFATTEPQKIPATILSRCQRFDLRRIPLKLLMERLRLIAKAEEIELDEDALLAIARAAEGGLRDAESALDQLISFQGKRIAENDVLAVFGLVSRQALADLMTALLSGDMAAMIRLVEAWDRQGKDLQRLLFELLEYGRNLLVFIQVGAGVAELDLSAAQLETLKTQTSLTSPDRLLRMMDILTETWDRLRYALSKKTLLETALIRCARAATTVALDEILAQVRALQSGGTPGGAARPPPAAPGRVLEGVLPKSPRSPPTSPDSPEVGIGAAAETRKTGDVLPVAGVADPASSGVTPGLVPLRAGNSSPSDLGNAPPAAEKNELAMLKKEWHALVERVGRAAPLAKGQLLDAFPAALDGRRALIGFDPEFADRMEQAAMPRAHAALQKVLGEMLGRPVEVAFKVMQPPSGNCRIAAESAPSVSARPPPAENAPAQALLQGKHKWMAQESVQKTLDMFNGRILDIKE